MLFDTPQARALYENSEDPTLQKPSDVPEEFDDPWDHQALAFDYYEQAYILWLDMVDDFVEPNENLEDRYGNNPLASIVVLLKFLSPARKNERAQMDLDEKTSQLEQSTNELNKLKSTAVRRFCSLSVRFSWSCM
jgi:kinetochore protein NDC80